MARMQARGTPCKVIPLGWPGDAGLTPEIVAVDPLLAFQARFGADWFRD